MSLRELTLRRSYDSGARPGAVVEEFYVPALSVSQGYDRVAGYFSSTALAVSARGIAGFIRNEGRMRLLVSPFLTEDDVAAFRHMGTAEGDELVDERLMDSFDLERLADQIARDHVGAMCWMLSQGRLEIRVVVPAGGNGGGGLFHQKVGILSDDAGNVLSFSGSVNETAAGWTHNIEHFKVFRGWIDVETDYVSDDVLMFERYWQGDGRTWRTRTLPEALRERLVAVTPPSFDPHSLDACFGLSDAPSEDVGTGLWPHQQRAVDAWLAAGGRGLLEMATGTGKTRTALECVRVQAETANGLLAVLTVPQQHLVAQWERDVRAAFPRTQVIEAHGGKPGWQAALMDSSCRIATGTRRMSIVIAVQNTAAREEFRIAAERVVRSGRMAMLVADEAHGLGAPQMRAALLDTYGHRLGLSATPSRWFDDAGTSLLLEYFGGVAFEFPIAEALATSIPGSDKSILTPYRYHPRFVSLDSDELDEYRELTKKAARAGSSGGESDGPSWEERFLFARAGLVKKANAKIGMLHRILEELGTSFSGCILYCSDRSQMTAAETVLDSHGIVYSEFTSDEGVAPEARFGGLSEREHILNTFSSGLVPMLVAMKCLDEGVDVPSASIGIILASSTNPREFIQRRGRLLRNADGKTHAEIYDVIVRPAPSGSVDEAARNVELKVFEKELRRVEEFASSADNAAECYAAVMTEINKLGN